MLFIEDNTILILPEDAQYSSGKYSSMSVEDFVKNPVAPTTEATALKWACNAKRVKSRGVRTLRSTSGSNNKVVSRTDYFEANSNRVTPSDLDSGYLQFNFFSLRSQYNIEYGSYEGSGPIFAPPSRIFLNTINGFDVVKYEGGWYFREQSYSFTTIFEITTGGEAVIQTVKYDLGSNLVQNDLVYTHTIVETLH